jgi:hypothetical protein
MAFEKWGLSKKTRDELDRIGRHQLREEIKARKRKECAGLGKPIPSELAEEELIPMSKEAQLELAQVQKTVLAPKQLQRM